MPSPPYDFNKPKYLSRDGAGKLYVADECNDRIVVLDSDDKLIASFGEGELNQSEGVAVKGDRVLLADTHTHRILLYRLR